MKAVQKRHYPFIIFIIIITTFICAFTQSMSWAEWKHYDQFNTNSKLPSSDITSLAMGNNRIWVGTDAGLAEFDPNMNMLSNPANGWTGHPELDLSYYPIAAMDMESNGIIWLGTAKGLVSFNTTSGIANPQDRITVYDPSAFPQIKGNITDIKADPNFVWVAASDFGLYRFTKSSKNWKQCNNGQNAPSYTYFIALGSANTLWILDGYFSFNVYKYAVASGGWESLEPPSVAVFNSITSLNNDDVWFGSIESGLWRYHLGVWTNWEQTDYGLPSDKIQFIKADRENNSIYVVTPDGVARYNADLDLWQRIGGSSSFELNNQVVKSITFDQGHKEVWFGTAFNGLYRWSEETILWSDPENMAENVPFGQDHKTHVIFNKSLKPDTVSIDYTSILVYTNNVPHPDGNQTYLDATDFSLTWFDPNTHTHLIISPTHPLSQNLWYTFVFSEGILYQTGVEWIEKDSLLFKTAEAPYIVNSTPANNALNIDSNAPIKLWFSKPMNTTSFFTFPGSITISPPIPPQGIDQENTVIQDPNNKTLLIIQKPLNPGTSYTLTISKNVKDIYGTPMQNDFSLHFTTQSTGPQPDRPQVIFSPSSPIPQPGAVDVPVSTNISLIFNHSMNPTSVRTNFVITPSIQGSFIWSDQNTRLVFDPNSLLHYSTEYTITISAPASDANGVSFGTSVSWSFTTEENIVTPQVTVYPQNGDSSVSIYTGIIALFNCPMHKGSVEGAFSLKDQSNATIVGSFTWNSTSSAFLFKPVNPLQNNQNYTATITTAAHSEAGIALPSNKIWTFRTIAASSLIEPPYGQNWPRFPIDFNIPGIPSLLNPDADMVITAITANREGDELWLGLASYDTGIGLGAFQFDGEKWKRYTTTNGLPSDYINDMVFDSHHNLWAATEDGAGRFDGVAWHTYTPADPNSFYIKDSNTMSAQGFLQVNAIDVFFGGTGEDLIWIATAGGIGVGKYDSGTDDWQWSAMVDPPYLCALSVNSATGRVWFGDLFWNELEPCGAIYGLDTQLIMNNISQWPHIWDIPDIWIWPPNGISPKIRYQGPAQRTLRALVEDHLGYLWLATDSGLYKINIQQLTMGNCEYEKYDPFMTKGGLSSFSIFDVKVNPNDLQLAVVTDQGIGLYYNDQNTSITDPNNWTQFPFISPVQIRASVEFVPTDTLFGGLLVGLDRGFFIIGDIVQPEVIKAFVDSQLLNGAVNVQLNPQIKITFSEFMNISISDSNAPASAISLTPAGSNNRMSVKNAAMDGKILTFQPSQPLSDGTTYTVKISNAAKDLAGNALYPSTGYSGNFTTVGSQIPPLSITSYQPQGNTTIDAKIAVVFSNDMDQNSVQSNFNLSPSVSGNFLWPASNRFIYTPDHLSFNTTYTVTLGAQTKDVYGNHLTASKVWTFTPVADPNFVPHVTAVYPQHGKTSISIYTDIFVFFDKPMDKGSIVSGAFELLDKATNNKLSGSFVWNDSSAFRFDPAGILANGHTYRITIKTSAQSSAGMPVPTEQHWEFTTLSAGQGGEPVPGQNWPRFPIDITVNYPTLPSLLSPDPNVVITAMAFDPQNGDLWAGMATRDPFTGIGLFHFNGQNWIQYTVDDGLPSNSINDLVFDSEGNLWIATEPDSYGKGGIARFDGDTMHAYDPNDPQVLNNRGTIPNAAIQDFYYANALDIYFTAGKEVIWAATTGGIEVGRYDNQKGDWVWSALTTPGYVYVISVNQSKAHVWFNSGIFFDEDAPCDSLAGLNAHLVENNFDQWPDVWSDPNIWILYPGSITSTVRYLGGSPYIKGIAEDSYGYLWLATIKGLYRIDVDDLKNGVCSYKKVDTFSTQGGLLSDLIYDVRIDPYDPTKLVVVTDKGVSIYNLPSSVNDRNNWIRYPFINPADPFASIAFIPSGGYVVSPGKGLIIIGNPGYPPGYTPPGGEPVPIKFIGDGCFVDSLNQKSIGIWDNLRRLFIKTP